MSVSKEQVLEALKQVDDPDLNQDIVSLQMVEALTISDSAIEVSVKLTTPLCPLKDKIDGDIIEVLKDEIEGDYEVKVDFSATVTSGRANTEPLLPGVKNIIVVASGKGGVGKSTVAVNLAAGFAKQGSKVGLIDADIYGPSIPTMFNLVNAKPGVVENNGKHKIVPIEQYGVKLLSIGFLAQENQAVVWRGPMVSSALKQFVTDAIWGELDYLVIDLPPGTGDTQLTLAQKVPVSGAIIVTTPQDIALLDARKGLKMFEKVEVPILGIVENMSTHICSECGHEEHIFGDGGGASLADEAGINLLGCLPLEMGIRLQADSGKPTVVSDPDSRTSEIYREVARSAAARLSRQAKDYSASFPNIVIQNT